VNRWGLAVLFPIASLSWSSASAQTLEYQAMCAAQAKKAFQEAVAEDKIQSQKFGMTTLSFDYQSHYNTKIKKCLILTGQTFTAGKQPTTSIHLWDAFERREYATWLWTAHETKKYWEQPPISCELIANYQSKRYCKTKEEFDAFVAEFMEE
jgi:hypothetical protein